jgi:hypothetical protein
MMSDLEALEALLKGKKIRKIFWTKPVYVHLVVGNLILENVESNDKGDFSFYKNPGDICSDNIWVEYVEPASNKSKDFTKTPEQKIKESVEDLANSIEDYISDKVKNFSKLFKE